jgi:hypothetical protein
MFSLYGAKYNCVPAICFIGLMISVAVPAKSDVILDTFSTAQSVMMTLPDPSNPLYFATSTNTAALGAALLGGHRSLAILTTVGDSEDEFRLRVSTATGTVRFATDSSIKGKGLITYDGSNSGVSTGYTGNKFNKPADYNIGGLNFLSLGGGISLFGYADNSGLPVVFTVYRDADNYATGTIDLPGSNSATFGSYNVSFKNFVVTGASSLNTILTDVRAFTVELNASYASVTPGTDAVIDYIAITGVPEPATLGLVGLSLVGVGMLRRRRQWFSSVR